MAGTLTRLQMATEVLDNLSKAAVAPTRSGTALSERVVVWLNRAQIKIARVEDLLFNIATASTVSSQQSYAFPSNVRAVFSLRLENGLDSVKLQPIMPWQFDKIAPKPNATTTGRPDWYIPYKTTNTFELFRIPDQAYTMRIRYSYWPTSLTSDSQTSDFTYLDDVIIQWATCEGFRWMQELKDAEYWNKRAEETLAEALQAERDAFPDWEPAMEGFSSRGFGSIGEYYNDPFVSYDPRGGYR